MQLLNLSLSSPVVAIMTGGAMTEPANARHQTVYAALKLAGVGAFTAMPSATGGTIIAGVGSGDMMVGTVTTRGMAASPACPLVDPKSEGSCRQ